jgi:hypothetical protein
MAIVAATAWLFSQHHAGVVRPVCAVANDMVGCGGQHLQMLLGRKCKSLNTLNKFNLVLLQLLS